MYRSLRRLPIHFLTYLDGLSVDADIIGVLCHVGSSILDLGLQSRMKAAGNGNGAIDCQKQKKANKFYI